MLWLELMSSWEPVVILLQALSALALAVSGVARGLVLVLVRHEPRREPRADSVDILKPLCGVDCSLRDNLEAFSRQSHTRARLIFGVASPLDDALPVAQRFCRDHVEVPTLISVGEALSLHNPKVALLSQMSRHCAADWVVVSDSNVRVTDEYVRDALSYADPDVGLITHLVSGAGGASCASHIESLQLNCFVAPGVCGARYVLGQTCVIGKSMFLRRDVLESIGGFESAGGYLAEDWVLGRAVLASGYRVVTASAPVPTWNEGWTLGRFASRHLRWAVMRRQVSRAAYALEPLLTPGPLLTLLLVLAWGAPDLRLQLPWVAAGLAADQLLDFAAHSRMSGKRAPLLALLLNPLRQWLTLALWALGWVTHTVEWRGKTYRVGPGSRLEPLGAASSTPTASVPR